MFKCYWYKSASNLCLNDLSQQVIPNFDGRMCMTKMSIVQNVNVISTKCYECLSNENDHDHNGNIIHYV
jgi:hypothetical protein